MQIKQQLETAEINRDQARNLVTQLTNSIQVGHWNPFSWAPSPFYYYYHQHSPLGRGWVLL